MKVGEMGVEKLRTPRHYPQAYQAWVWIDGSMRAKSFESEEDCHEWIHEQIALVATKGENQHGYEV
jgi:hypothetical protein